MAVAWRRAELGHGTGGGKERETSSSGRGGRVSGEGLRERLRWGMVWVVATWSVWRAGGGEGGGVLGGMMSRGLVTRSRMDGPDRR